MVCLSLVGWLHGDHSQTGGRIQMLVIMWPVIKIKSFESKFQFFSHTFEAKTADDI